MENKPNNWNKRLHIQPKIDIIKLYQLGMAYPMAMHHKATVKYGQQSNDRQNAST